VLVTPWATHQHGLLLPEQLGAPLLLGAAMLAARPATARAAGVLAGVAVFAKLPFVVPAALLIAVSPARRTAARWAAGAIVAQAVAFTALFGIEFWRQIITAQVQAGNGSSSRSARGLRRAGPSWRSSCSRPSRCGCVARLVSRRC
jgi:hypothetical protein